ncbi:MAG TPA: hypothetical protein DCF68_16985 [Cyanothece sp. UBA12306]|nr:hypothetical protein [Cyanothece sp. UBA12306]
MSKTHAPKVLTLPGLRRYHQCHVRDIFYTVGESLLDSVSLLWFDNTEALQTIMESPEYCDNIVADFANFVDPKYIHTLVTKETWIIGPEFRS